MEILRNVKRGDTNFSFTVRQENDRVKGTWFTVLIKQLTDMRSIPDFGADEFVCTWKVICPTSPTEHAAINYAGKKIIKDWKNLN